MHQGNIFSQIALLLWFPLGLLVANKFRPQVAVLIIYLGGVLLLPQRVFFGLPGLPDFDKHAVAGLSAWLSCQVVSPAAFSGRRLSGRMQAIAVLFAVGIAMTVITNRDALSGRAPGLGFSDFRLTLLAELLKYFLPYYLGVRIFRNCDDLRTLLRAIVLAALLYAPLVMLEVRLSPFLHAKVYGFLQHSWIQQKREGGFRALVFMAHGLAVALFIAQGLIAGAGLAGLKRHAGPPGGKALALAVLALTLALSKSMAAAIYGLVITPLSFFTSARFRLAVARVLAVAVLCFPLLRLNGLVPVGWLAETALRYSPERGESLIFRFDNEDILLARARERFLFGWGGWSRGRVFDPLTGEDISTTDGQWIIVLGEFGVFGYLLIFGMLVSPIFLARRAARTGVSQDDVITLAAAALVLVTFSVDLLPNGLFHRFPYMLAGALLSVSRSLAAPEQTA